MLFVLSHKGEYLVFCHKCAMAMEKSFTVLRQVSVSLNSAMCWFQVCAIMCTHLLREWVFILSCGLCYPPPLQFDTEELQQTLDKFKLHPPPVYSPIAAH